MNYDNAEMTIEEFYEKYKPQIDKNELLPEMVPYMFDALEELRECQKQNILQNARRLFSILLIFDNDEYPLANGTDQEKNMTAWVLDTASFNLTVPMSLDLMSADDNPEEYKRLLKLWYDIEQKDIDEVYNDEVYNFSQFYGYNPKEIPKEIISIENIFSRINFCNNYIRKKMFYP